MKFKELAEIEVGSNLLSAGCAVVMAIYGLEYWALAMRPVLLATFMAFGTWFRCRWIPEPPATKSAGAKEMLRQGLHCASFLVTDYIANSSDRIVIGYRSGPIPLGYYQNAMFLYENLCALLILSAHNVVVASLGKAKNNLQELRRLWGKALLTLEFYAMPAFGILAVTGHDLAVVLFGPKWSEAGVLISILALRGIPAAVERTMGWLHVASGRTDRWMRWGVIAMCAKLIAIFCGLAYGPTGVAVSLVVCSSILFIPAIAYSGRPLGVGASDVIGVVWRPLVATVLATAAGFTLRFMFLADMSALLRISILALAFVTAYLAIIVGVLRERMPILVAIALIRDTLLVRSSCHLRGAPPIASPRN